jgi:UDP-N-acetyl-2-amino-2-deoxyglucuronate dehydrogenase
MYRFALVGCGNISSRHAENIKRVGKLTAVCDIIPEKADWLAARFDAKPYYSIDDLLTIETNTDVIVVCTPNGLHAEHSIISLNAGKHVLCEKPMCLTAKDAAKMIDAAASNRKKIFVVKQNRYNEPVQYVKNLLDKNKLGKIYSFQINCFWNRPQAYYIDSWKGTKKLDGGILYTQFSHFIDLLHWLLGDIDLVNGYKETYGNRSQFEIEDTGVAILKMKSGAMGTLNYTINVHSKNLEGSFSVFGEKGSVKIGGQYLNTLEWFDVEGEPKPTISLSHLPNDYGYYQGSMSNHHKVYDDLIRSIDGDGNLLEAKDAIATVEIIESIYNSSTKSH